MRTASVREVQHHLNKVLAWVEKGEEVQITRRDKIVAKITAASIHPSPTQWPDFAERARAIWGRKPKGKSLRETILRDRKERS